METKVCNKCGVEKPINSFEYRKDRNSYRNTCKECRYNSRKEKYELSKDEKNKRRREKYQKNKDEINEKRRKIYAEIKEDYNTKRRNRKITNPKTRLREQLLNTINRSFERKGYTRTKSYEELLSCSIDRAVDGLLITYKAMYHKEWDGIVKVHIDHLVPLALARNVKEVEKLCHTGNLCLLTQKDNIKKGGRLNDGIGRNGKRKYVPYYYLDPDDFFDSEEVENDE